MPYISQDARLNLFTNDNGPEPNHAGELNYLFTSIIIKYIEQHGLRYSTLNDIIGALECCKLELYRRIIIPYEDKKIAENEDVYPANLITGDDQ